MMIIIIVISHTLVISYIRISFHTNVNAFQSPPDPPFGIHHINFAFPSFLGSKYHIVILNTFFIHIYHKFIHHVMISSFYISYHFTHIFLSYIMCHFIYHIVTSSSHTHAFLSWVISSFIYRISISHTSFLLSYHHLYIISTFHMLYHHFLYHNFINISTFHRYSFIFLSKYHIMSYIISSFYTHLYHNKHINIFIYHIIISSFHIYHHITINILAYRN